MRATTRSLLLASLLATFAALPGCSTEPASSATDDHAATLRAYVDALNRGDESYLDDYFGPG